MNEIKKTCENIPKIHIHSCDLTVFQILGKINYSTIRTRTIDLPLKKMLVRFLRHVTKLIPIQLNALL